jgi:hypothetical protein
MAEQYQTVVLILADGRTARYSGRVQLSSEDKIVNVEVTPPMKLPDGMTFDKLTTTQSRESCPNCGHYGCDLNCPGM